MDTQNESAEQASGASRGGRVIAIVLLVVGLLVGVVSGALVAGPLLNKGAEASAKAAPKKAAPADRAESPEGGEEALAEEEEGYEESGSRGATAGAEYVVDDIVLNPAGSQGTRFLLASVAFQVKDEAAATQMKGRESEIRDAILGVLGNKTVEELVVPDSSRAQLKTELRRSVSKILPRGAVRRVYLPKFVVQ